MRAHEKACERRDSPQARYARVRRAARGVGWILLLVTPILFTACAENNITRPDGNTLTGRVRLVGTLMSDTGESTGVQLVDNADSVRVYLYQGPTRKDSTRTVSGGYRFDGLRGGPYSVVTVLWGEIGDTVSVASVTANTAADTLVIPSSPTMFGYPNPCVGPTAVFFQVPSPSSVELIVRKPSGLTVRSLLQQDVPAGYQQVTWDTRDDSGSLVSAGPYWFLFRTGSDYRCRLVVRM